MKINVTVYSKVCNISDAKASRNLMNMYIKKYGWIIDKGVLYSKVIV